MPARISVSEWESWTPRYEHLIIPTFRNGFPKSLRGLLGLRPRKR